MIKTCLDLVIIGMNFLQQNGCELRIIPTASTDEHGGFNNIHVGQINSLQVKPNHPGEEDSAIDKMIKTILENELTRFKSIAGPSNVTEHVITMKHSRPFRQRYYPRNPGMQKIISDQIDELLKEGKIEPSKSPYSSPIVLARKKNDDYRRQSSMWIFAK